MLIYACQGLEVTPEVDAAVTAAQATWVTEAPPALATDPLAALTPVALPLLEPSAVDPAAAAADPAAAAAAAATAAAGQDAAPGNHHHHHHHHHRHLLQGTTATKEWASPWPFLVSETCSRHNPQCVTHHLPATCSCSCSAHLTTQRRQYASSRQVSPAPGAAKRPSYMQQAHPSHASASTPLTDTDTPDPTHPACSVPATPPIPTAAPNRRHCHHTHLDKGTGLQPALPPRSHPQDLPRL
jgi:hypothetical protein